MTNSQSRLPTLLTIIAAILVGVLIVWFLSPSRGEQLQQNVAPDSSDLAADSTDIATNVEDRETDDETLGQADKPTSNFAYILPGDWDLRAKAEDGIASISKGQSIEFGIVTDPTDEDFVYFASSVFDARLQENLVSIYKYNTENLLFDRLFRESYGEDEFSHIGDGFIPVFHVLGYDNGQLVFLAQPIDDSPGPCAQPLLLNENNLGARALLSMNILDPYGGFKAYEPPQEAIDLAQEQEAECQNTLN